MTKTDQLKNEIRCRPDARRSHESVKNEVVQEALAMEIPSTAEELQPLEYETYVLGQILRQSNEALRDIGLAQPLTQLHQVEAQFT